MGTKLARACVADSMQRRAAAGLLTLVGILVMGIGAYFVVLRPAFLPEDLRFIGADPSVLATAAPGIKSWLHSVFVVLGAYAFTTGLFTTFIAVHALRSGCRMPALLIGLTGLTSVGVMVAVNFAISSEYRFLLAGLGGLWALSAIMNLQFGRRSKKENR